MRPPSATAYMEAVQHPASCFSDPVLASATPVVGPLGLPVAVSGNVATVFRVDTASGASYAVRCFVRTFDDEERRYREIAAHLAPLAAPWRVPFEFQPAGILVDGSWWPVVKMAWSSGMPLLAYLEANMWDAPSVAYLAVRFAALCEGLRAAQVAHGDLQHGNILVAPGGDLRLVDYDGMYVPGLHGMASNERGHRHYQHPGRDKRHFGPHLDHFSSWVIYASLTAIATDPLLWGRLDGGEECLLFRQDDFEDPGRSAALAAFEESGDGALAALAKLLRSFLERDVPGVPPLTLAGAPKPALAGGELGALRDAGDLAERQSLYAALRQGRSPAAPASSTRASVPRGAPGAAAGDRAGTRPARAGAGARVVAGGAVAGATLAAVLAVLAVRGGDGAVTAGALALVILVACLAAARLLLRGPGSRQRPASASSDARSSGGRSAEVDAARAALDEVTRRRARVDVEETAALAAAEKARDELTRQEGAELRAVEDRLREGLGALAARQQDLARAEQDASAAALEELHRQLLAEELQRRPLAAVTARGVSDNVLYGLALEGVRTAGDFVDIVPEDGGAVVVLRDGRRIRARGMEPDQAKALLRWRRHVEADVQLALPDALPPARRTILAREQEAARAALAEEERALRADAGRAADEVRARWKARHERVVGDLERARAGAARRRVELDRELNRAAKRVAEAEWRAGVTKEGRRTL